MTRFALASEDYPYRVAEIHGEVVDQHATVHAYRIKNNDTCDEVTACRRYLDPQQGWHWVEQPNDKQVSCLLCLGRLDG